MQAYPDAQLYRFKTVPSFNKLCVIYGEEGSNGKPSNMAHSEDLDGIDPVLMVVNWHLVIL